MGEQMQRVTQSGLSHAHCHPFVVYLTYLTWEATTIQQLHLVELWCRKRRLDLIHLSLYNIAQSGLNLLGILLCSVQRRGQKGPWRLELQNLCGLLPLSTGGLITDWQLPLSKALFYWEKSEKKEESIVIQKNGMTCIVINTNVQKNVIDFCLPFFYARGNMSQVSHISFISNPEHLEARGKEPKKVPLRIRIIAVTML